MRKLNNVRRKILTFEDFEKYPIWTWDDEIEYKLPITEKKRSRNEMDLMKILHLLRCDKFSFFPLSYKSSVKKYQEYWILDGEKKEIMIKAHKLLSKEDLSIPRAVRFDMHSADKCPKSSPSPVFCAMGKNAFV